MNKLVSAVLSLYIGLFLYSVLPFTKVLTGVTKGSLNLFWNHLGILALFVIPLWFIINRVISDDPGRGLEKFIRLVLLGVGFSGLLISVFYHIIPIAPIYEFPSVMDKFFQPDIAYSVWLIAPLLILFF